LVVTTVCINVGVAAVLWSRGYRPDERSPGDPDTRRRVLCLVSVVLLAVALTGALAGTYQQLDFERDATRAASEVISRPAYDGLDVVTVRSDFGLGSVSSPRTVTVMVRRTSNRAYPSLPERVQRRVAARTDGDPTVRIR
jgi:hypothetical protein